MAAEEVLLLKLFDTFWFEQGILSTNTHRFSCDHVPHNKVLQENPHEIQQSANLFGRSESDYCISLDNTNSITSFSPLGNSPTSVIITSNKVAEAVQMKDNKQKRRIKDKRGVKGIIRIRRSSSDLELEELKGFMDLGFEFNEEDKNSRLVTIVPGLQKWGNKAVDEEVENSTSKKKDIVQRPYLSEAWEILEKRKMIRKLVKWRFPAMHNEINMKDNLRFWAQTVASTFR
ncbi:uncharacterized protein LOC132029340 [Lycium ferocissimum]|uniref:uncharacterized protein LOC132029340 n=1 Tax=Lycium ferocissimum TaxID=112874 RepID=UPI0028163AC1|nr:uncharacterized protein LOC132029340 [Lycium ferocissimum]